MITLNDYEDKVGSTIQATGSEIPTQLQYTNQSLIKPYKTYPAEL